MSDWMRRGRQQRRGVYAAFYGRVLEAMPETGRSDCF